MHAHAHTDTHTPDLPIRSQKQFNRQLPDRLSHSQDAEIYLLSTFLHRTETTTPATLPIYRLIYEHHYATLRQVNGGGRDYGLIK